MHTRTTTAAALLTAGLLLLTACSSSSDSGDKATPTTTPPAATTASTTPAAGSKVKLSTKWVPKLEALSNGDGVSACQTSGSLGCVHAMTTAVDAFGSIAKEINAAGAADEYAKTIADINKYVRAADAFDKAGCSGDPNADVGDSSCGSNALTVVTGPTILQFVMPTDELTAGVG